MADNVRIHKTPTKDEIEAWDKYAAAVLAAICSSKPIGDKEAAEVAAKFADSLLEQRRIKLNALQEEANAKTSASIGALKL